MSIKPFTLSFRSALLWLAGLFLILFFVRLAYSSRSGANYTDGATGVSFEFASPNYKDSGPLRKNYASEKNMQEPAAPPGQGSGMTQKYEKTATLNARTDDFEQDEKRIRQTSDVFKAIIQYEQRTGNPGHRQLHLMIGVRPELFDSFYVAAQGIGAVFVNEVTKVDKTTEFRELNAKKASLQQALASLTDLKNRAGSITDLVGLHDKILDIERQLQELGVELGNFDAENEFCTFRISLIENAATRTISFAHRVWDAFTWTVQYYALLLLGLAFVLVVAWLLMTVVNKAVEIGQKK